MRKEELTDAVWKCLSLSARAELEARGIMPPHQPLVRGTTEERILKAGLELEREEHNQFEGFLKRNEYAYVHSRTDKRTSQNLGVPDFIIGARVGLAIEFKRRGGKLSTEQETWRKQHETRGGVYKVVESYEQARDITEALAP